ncbi:MAG TPA: DUF664 domain-containing protein [Acidimicrobiales bacterium]|nr:DUF664 domain-containing protein [Acidimicrobiales bacterium]
MRPNQLLIDAFGRIEELTTGVVDGLTPEQLAWRADAEANTIAWLVWHLTRIQDDHIADVAGEEQSWRTDGWARRFDLPWDDSETGYSQDAGDVAKLVVDADLLAGYHRAVARRTRSYLELVADDELERVVDERWDPPVTLAVRLVSVVSDDLQHVGQAAFVRGLLERSGA